MARISFLGPDFWRVSVLFPISCFIFALICSHTTWIGNSKVDSLEKHPRLGDRSLLAPLIGKH
jgi:uncharacterized membrane protein